MDVEERFGISIPDAELERCQTVADLTKLVQGRIQARSSFAARLRCVRDEVRSAILELQGNGSAPDMRRRFTEMLEPADRRRLWKKVERMGWRASPLGCSRPGYPCFWTAVTLVSLLSFTAGVIYADWGVACIAVTLALFFCFLFASLLSLFASTPPEDCSTPSKLARTCARAELAAAPAASPPELADVEDEVRRLVAEACGLRLEEVKPESNFLTDLML